MCNHSKRLSLWMRSIMLIVTDVFSVVFSRLVGWPTAGSQLSVVSYVKGLKMIINDRN